MIRQNTRMHRKPAAGRNRDASVRQRTSSRQHRQHAVVSVVGGKKLTLRKMRRLQGWVLWLKEHRAGGYRWIAQHTSRRFGWWQQIGAGNFGRLHPVQNDYESVQRIYEILQGDARLDSRVVDLLLGVMEARAQMDMALNELIKIARRRAGSDEVNSAGGAIE